jgi:TonB-dependent receptor
MRDKDFSPGRVLSRTALLLVFAVSFGSPLAAQSGAIAGHVSGGDHRALAGAAVWVSGTGRSARTDELGDFRILGVNPGTYFVVSDYLGYARDSVSVTVAAGQGARAEVGLRTAAVELNALTVLVERAGQARALNKQRTADVVSNIVAADQIGRFPDPNTAEALQRVPGIAIQRDQGEGRYVLIRGTEPRLNGSTLNGVNIPSPESDVRMVALDDVPADALASIEVKKTFTPDMDADAIGGTANLVTRMAERGPAQMSLTAAAGQNNLTGKKINQAAGLFARRFGTDQRLGFMLGGSYYRTPRGSNDIEQTWKPATVDGAGTSYVGNLQLRDYLVTRTRGAVTGTLDYDAGTGNHVALRGIWSSFGDQEFRRNSQIRFDKGTVDPAAGTSSGGQLIRALKDRYEVQRIASVALQGTTTRPTFGVDYELAWAHSEESEPHSHYFTFTQKKVNLSYDMSDTDAPRYTVTKGSEFDPTAYAFTSMETVDGLATDRNLVGSVVVTVPLNWQVAPMTLKFGGKARMKRKDYSTADLSYNAYTAGTLTLADLASEYENTDFQYGYKLGVNSDPGRARSLIADHLSSFTLDPTATASKSSAPAYLAHENVYSSFAMATIDAGKLRLVPGVRLESTRSDFDANVVNFDSTGVFVGTQGATGDHSYVDVLPGINARLEIDSRTNLRAAVTRSLARPNYFDMVPYRQVSAADNTISEGNPDLVPTHSTNFDLMAEHYFSSVGIVSAGVFHKLITDFITPTVHHETITGTDYTVTQPGQGDNAHLTGVELAWQQRLTMLPGALSGLGFYANWTWSTSTATYPLQDRSAILPGQMPNVGNFSIFYERYGINARLAANYSDRFVSEVGEDASADVYYDRHLQYDASASVQLLPGVRVFAEAINLTNEPLRYYQGMSNHPIQQEFYSWWGHVGVRLDGIGWRR